MALIQLIQLFHRKYSSIGYIILSHMQVAWQSEASISIFNSNITVNLLIMRGAGCSKPMVKIVAMVTTSGILHLSKQRHRLRLHRTIHI